MAIHCGRQNATITHFVQFVTIIVNDPLRERGWHDAVAATESDILETVE